MPIFAGFISYEEAKRKTIPELKDICEALKYYEEQMKKQNEKRKLMKPKR